MALLAHSRLALSSPHGSLGLSLHDAAENHQQQTHGVNDVGILRGRGVSVK